MPTSPVQAPTAPRRLHACFALAGHQRLNLPEGIAPREAWHYLSHQVQRRPQDLAEHTRRILLCVHPALRYCLPGALADLFQILGQRGYALREHLLGCAAVALSERGRRFFRCWLEEGACPVSPTPRFVGAVVADAGTLAPGLLSLHGRTLQARIHEAEESLQDERALGLTRTARRALSEDAQEVAALATLHALARQGGERAAVKRYRERLLRAVGAAR